MSRKLFCGNAIIKNANVNNIFNVRIHAKLILVINANRLLCNRSHREKSILLQ